MKAREIKRIFFSFTGCCIFLLIPFIAKAQQSSPATHESKLIYLHTDRQIYSPGEYIRLEAYQLNPVDKDTLNTLHLLLTNEMTGKPVVSKNYLFSRSSISGRFYLPDSLKSGKYGLIAYVNASTNDDKTSFFRKEITLISDRPAFDIHFAGKVYQDSVHFKALITDNDHLPQQGVELFMEVFFNGKSYKTITGLSNTLGEVEFILPLALMNLKPEVRGSMQKSEDKINFKTSVRWESTIDIIDFYPKGGKMLSGRSSRMLIKAYSTSGKSLSEKFWLYEDGVAQYSFETDINGWAMINFIPQKGRIYQVKKSGQQEFSSQAFPVITDADWFVNGPDEFKDSLQLELIRPVGQSECILLIEQSGIKRYQAHVKLPSAESKLRLNCSAWPPGVARLTIYSLSGILLAKKNFRIIDRDPINFSLTVDSSTYHPNSKVKIGLQLSDRLGKPMKGTFSMSVTTKKTRNTDIASIENLFNTFIPEEFGSERYREHILCYLDNTRPEVENTLLTTNHQEIAAVRGHVLYDEKPLRKSLNLILMGEKTHIIQTAKDGQFEVPAKLLAGQGGTKWMLSVLGKYSLGYRIIVSPLFKEKDELLAAKYFQLNDSYAADLSYVERQNLFRKDVKQLQEISVKAIFLGNKHFEGKIDSTGRCFDYVCYLGFLNCQSHGRGTPGQITPEEGHKYFVEGLTGTETIIYHCRFKNMQPYIKMLETIAFPEVNASYISTLNNTAEEENNNSFIWLPEIGIDENGVVQLEFSTPKKRGEFVIAVQGIGAGRGVCRQISFKVME